MRAKGDGGAGRVVRVAKWVVASAVVVVVGGAAVPVAADSDAAQGVEERPASGVALASDVLSEIVRAPLEHAQVLRDGRVRVEVVHHGETRAVARLITHVGGTVNGSVGDGLIDALVPVGELVRLEGDRRVRYLRPPVAASVVEWTPSAAGPGLTPLVDGEEIAKMGASAWHSAGYSGQGVKVGIIDVFSGDLWSSAQAAGEVPAVPEEHTFCTFGEGPCDVWGSSAKHGVGVAEIIHEVAPAAELYLAGGIYPLHDFAAVDMQATVDFFAANGVDVISHSATAEFDGPGDGTGPLAQVVDSAVAQGMVWVNSAGNTAGDGSRPGQYWRGIWADADGDSWLEFTGTQEYIEFDSCGMFSGVRWSDWGETGVTDYDVLVVDDIADLGDWDKAVVSSRIDQTIGADPVEYLYKKLLLNDPRGDCGAEEQRRDYLQIQLFAAGAEAAGDVIEIRVNGSYLDPWTNDYSAAGPFADSASPGAMAVGAIDPPDGVAAGFYSAWGPTNDGRVKPDLMAAAGVLSFVYQGSGWGGDGRFHGTSAAAPGAAGAAALVLSSGVASSPADVKSYLLSQAVVDRGPGGLDNQYGHGELILPAPPEPPPTLQISSPTAGTTVSDVVTITAASTGTVTAVEFAVDGSPIGIDADGGDGWSMTWDSTSVPDGSHTLSVEAVNDPRAANSVVVISTNAPQSLTITQPADGATVQDLIKIAASSTGDITSVRFEIDGTLIGTDTTPGDGWQWFWATGNVADGVHTVTVRAGNNAAVSDTITVTVDNAAVLAITAPPSGATVSGTVAIQVASTGDIDGVRFEIDGGLVGTDTTAGDGWRFDWDTAGTVNGPHVITVRATNDATVSDSRGVIVNNPVTLCRGLVATIVGTAGNDFLTGTAGPDVIHGLGGDDSLSGLGGDDVICGGDGEDFLYGGPGNDTLSGQAHHDNLKGGDGDDTLLGGGDDDYLSGGDGNDLLRGQLGNDWSWGEAGDDRIQDGPGNDGLDGGPGKDKLWGGIGADLLWGGEGRDQMHGGRDNDSLYGDADTDRMWGDSGDDHLSGGSGSDFLYGGIGADDLWGRDGNDRLFGWKGNDELWGGPGKDQLRGQAGNDTVDGGLHYDWCSMETERFNCEQAL